MSYDSPRMEAAMKALREDLKHPFHDAPRRAATLALAAADAVMFHEATEAKIAELLYQMRDYTWQIQARAVIAVLKGDGE
jgi:hypothetical protein